MTFSVSDVARIAHQANKALCESCGDFSQPDWADAPSWQIESAINGVKFHNAHPGAGPQGSHNNWMAEKVADGWVYGEVKDPAARTHPCLVPFEELPPEQQVKDHLFRNIVHAFMPFMEGDNAE